MKKISCVIVILLLSFIAFLGFKFLRFSEKEMKPLIISPDYNLQYLNPSFSEKLRYGLNHYFFPKKESPKVAVLTFDDGPYPLYTPLLLNLLKRENIRATFFIVGNYALEYPELLRMISLAGHEIGNHSLNHIRLEGITEEMIRREIDETTKIIKKITGKTTHLLRPPGGNYNMNNLSLFQQMGYTSVFYSNNPGDWMEEDPQKIEKRILENMKPISIILLHSGRINTIKALEKVIPQLKAHGYRFATIGEIENLFK